MSEMVERVARAMCEQDAKGATADGPQISRAGWRAYEPMARAAIEAMREPTDAMTEAGTEQLYGHPRSKAEEWGKADKFESWTHDANRTFSAMISAALNDKIPAQP